MTMPAIATSVPSSAITRRFRAFPSGKARAERFCHEDPAIGVENAVGEAHDFRQLFLTRRARSLDHAATIQDRPGALHTRPMRKRPMRGTGSRLPAPRGRGGGSHRRRVPPGVDRLREGDPRGQPRAPRADHADTEIRLTAALRRGVRHRPVGTRRVLAVDLLASAGEPRGEAAVPRDEFRLRKAVHHHRPHARVFHCGLAVERGFVSGRPSIPGIVLKKDWDWHRLMAQCAAGSELDREMRRLVAAAKGSEPP